MEITPSTLAVVSNLELRRYAGDLEAIDEYHQTLLNELSQLPVRVEITAPRGICEDELYGLVLRTHASYQRFSDLRIEVCDNSLNSRAIIMLSVLFDGIYVGEPEDLLHFRRGERREIMYPTKGLGAKLADVRFIEPQ